MEITSEFQHKILEKKFLGLISGICEVCSGHFRYGWTNGPIPEMAAGRSRRVRDIAGYSESCCFYFVFVFVLL